MRPRKPAYTQRLLARNLRERRLRKSWTQYDLANQTRLRQALISEIEAGKANPTLLSLHKIAVALGIEVAELTLPPGAVLADVPGTNADTGARGRVAKKRRGRPPKSAPR